MISLVFTQDNIMAAVHKGASGRALFTIPLAIEDGGYVGVAKRVKAALKASKIKTHRLCITLVENVVFKEFSHQPASPKLIGSLGALEARTTLGEQIDNFAISCMSYGGHRNEMGEENSMLLATPLNLLKGIQTAFAGEGLSVTAIHSGFDAYTSAVAKLLPMVMPDKSCATIDFEYEYTYINIYVKGKLASQRRLQGLNGTMVPTVARATGIAEDEIVKQMKDKSYIGETKEKMIAALTDFVWDVLRTVRVVCAPLHVDMDGFFVSGIPCTDKAFCETIRSNMGNACVFADELITERMAGFTKPITGELLHIGSQLSKLDLLLPVKKKRKSFVLDSVIYVALALAVVAGMCVQPVAILMRTSDVKAENQKLALLAPVSAAMEKTANASARLQSITDKRLMLKSFTSNVGISLPDVMSLFKGGLVPKAISYSGETGMYIIRFTATDKDEFLRFKADIYKNEKYALSLSLTSEINNEGTLSCTLSFIPASYVPRPEPVQPPAVQEDNEIAAETIMKDLGGDKSGSK